jgi:hypothetical protein
MRCKAFDFMIAAVLPVSFYSIFSVNYSWIIDGTRQIAIRAIWCEGPDLNRRTTAGRDLESLAFGPWF